jgi:hypothetical protein
LTAVSITEVWRDEEDGEEEPALLVVVAVDGKTRWVRDIAWIKRDEGLL